MRTEEGTVSGPGHVCGLRHRRIGVPGSKYIWHYRKSCQGRQNDRTALARARAEAGLCVHHVWLPAAVLLRVLGLCGGWTMFLEMFCCCRSAGTLWWVVDVFIDDLLL